MAGGCKRRTLRPTLHPHPNLDPNPHPSKAGVLTKKGSEQYTVLDARNARRSLTEALHPFRHLSIRSEIRSRVGPVEELLEVRVAVAVQVAAGVARIVRVQ